MRRCDHKIFVSLVRLPIMNFMIGILIFLLSFIHRTFTRFHDIPLCGIVRQSCPGEAFTWREREREVSCTGKKRYACMHSQNGSIIEACIFVGSVPPNTTGCPVYGDCDKESGLQIVTATNYKPCNNSLPGCPKHVHEGYNTTVLYQYPECISFHTSKKPKHDSSASYLQIIIGITAVAVVIIAVGVISFKMRLKIKDFCCNAKPKEVQSTGCRDTDSSTTSLPRELNVTQETQDCGEMEQMLGESQKENVILEDTQDCREMEEMLSESHKDNDILEQTQDFREREEILRESHKGNDILEETQDCGEMEEMLGESQKENDISEECSLTRFMGPQENLDRGIVVPAPFGSVQAELIYYLDVADSTRILLRLERPMLSLMTNAPRAIEKFGQLHIWTKRYCDEFRTDRDSGKNLKELVEDMRQKCEQSFMDVSRKMSTIKNNLEHIVQQCSNAQKATLFKNKETHNILQPILNDVRNSSQECTKLCTENLKQFKEVESVKEEISNALISREKNLNYEINKLAQDEVSKNGELIKEKNIEALQNLKERCKDALLLSKDMNNEWNNIVRFFEMFEDIIRIHIDRSIEAVTSSMDPIRVPSEDPNGEGLSTLIEVNSSTINENAKYARTITMIYTLVSMECILPCVAELQPMIKYHSSDTSDLDGERLKTACEEAGDKIASLLHYIDDMKMKWQLNRSRAHNKNIFW